MTAVSLKVSPEKEQNEQSEIQLEVIEEIAKKYLKYFYGPDLLDKGVIIVPKALKQIYKELGITLTEYAVMELLLSRWYREKAQPAVSIAILAAELGKSKLQIWRHLKKLQQKGMLGIEHIYDEDGAQRHNRYDIFPFIRRLDAYVNNRDHYTRADTPVEVNEQPHDKVIQSAANTPQLSAASSEAPITEESGVPQPEGAATAQLSPAATMLIQQVQQESSPERVEPVIATLPPTQPNHADEPFQLPPPALGPKTPGRSPQAYTDDEPFQLPPPALGPKTPGRNSQTHANDEPFQLPPPALGPKTPGRKLSLITEATNKREPEMQAQKASQASSQKKEATEKKKTERTKKSRKKEEKKDDPLTPRAIAEGVNRIVNMYIDADASEQEQRIQTYTELMSPTERRSYSEEASAVATTLTIDEIKAQFEDDQEGKLLPARVIEYMNECIATFTDTVFTREEGYACLVRIYKKAQEAQLVSNDYKDEHIEANFLNAMVRAAKQAIDEYQATTEQVEPIDMLVNFIELLEDNVEQDRYVAAYDWKQQLLDIHEKQFYQERWGIPTVRQPAIPAAQMLANPRALIQREKSSARAPYGLELVTNLRHYGIKLDRQTEYNLLSKTPDFNMLKKVRDVLRMEQFQDEREQFKRIMPWLITGSSFELYCYIYLNLSKEKLNTQPTTENTNGEHEDQADQSDQATSVETERRAEEQPESQNQ